MKTNSKRSVAVAIFNSNLKTLNKVGGRVFRKNVLETIEADTGVTRACAAAMYNHAKKLATAANPALVLGRVAKAAEDVVADVVEPVAVENNDAWAVVDADGNVVGTYASRAKARAAKGEGQRAVAR